VKRATSHLCAEAAISNLALPVPHRVVSSHAADIAADTLEPNTASVLSGVPDAGDWGAEGDYVPLTAAASSVGPAADIGMELYTLQAALAPLAGGKGAKKPVGAQQSFVLSNVFAGCPLEVLCAASWRCRPQGGAECLYIIVGASTGLYILETHGVTRELVQVSKRVCSWLYVMDEEGMMISVSGQGLVCVHDLNSLLVGPSEQIKFKTTKLIEDARGGRCAVTRTPDTSFVFLCAAMTNCLILMQWYVAASTPYTCDLSFLPLCAILSAALPFALLG
jgi:hypothetical protein